MFSDTATSSRCPIGRKFSLLPFISINLVILDYHTIRPELNDPLFVHPTVQIVTYTSWWLRHQADRIAIIRSIITVLTGMIDRSLYTWDRYLDQATQRFPPQLRAEIKSALTLWALRSLDRKSCTTAGTQAVQPARDWSNSLNCCSSAKVLSSRLSAPR